MITYTPYTYLIGWSKQDRWYYGVRYARGCHPNELWIKYFTSSKHVKKFRIEHGEPDVIQIRKIFDSKESAGIWEHRVIRRMNMVKSNRWLNKSDTKIHDRTGCNHSVETKEKLSIKRRQRESSGMLGHKHSDETKRQYSLVRSSAMRNKTKQERNDMLNAARSKVQEMIIPGKGLPWQDKVNKNPDKIRKSTLSNTGKKRTPEQKQRMSEARKLYLMKRKEIMTTEMENK